MLKAIVLSLLLLAVGADCRSFPQPTTPDMDTISIYIKKLLENLKEAMPRGIPELQIPPLEPLVLPVIDIPRIREGVADVKLDLKNFRMEGLSSFRVDKAKGDMQNMGIELDMYFPVLKGRSGYNLDGKILFFPLYGKGTAHVQVTDLRIKVKAAVSIQQLRTVQLTNLRLDVSFSQVQMYLEGIGGGGNLGDLINQLLNALGKLVFDQLKPIIMPEINRILVQVINSELRKVDLQDIIRGVLPSGRRYSLPADDSANIYVDRLMQELRPQVAKHVDPLAIPDQVARFSKRILLVTVWGSATLRHGQVRGLATIHRAGNCAISGAGVRVSVSCVIGVNGLNGGFSANAQFMGVGVSARVDFGVARVRVHFGVSGEVRDGATPNLDNFSITEVSNVGVRVSGLGPLNWILNAVANVVVNAVRPQIIRAIEGPVRNELRNVLASVKIPGLP